MTIIGGSSRISWASPYSSTLSKTSSWSQVGQRVSLRTWKKGRGTYWDPGKGKHPGCWSQLSCTRGSHGDGFRRMSTALSCLSHISGCSSSTWLHECFLGSASHGTSPKASSQKQKATRTGRQPQVIPTSSPPGQETVLTSVHWLWEVKKTRAKGSERPLLSAANKLLAWYMWARSWKTCFSATERGSGTAWYESLELSREVNPGQQGL